MDTQGLEPAPGAHHLSVDLTVRAGQVEGQLDDGCGRPTSFVGWVGLVAAIDRATRRPEREPGEARPLRLLESDGA